MSLLISVLALLVWLGLWFAHGRFWQAGPILDAPRAPLPRSPDVLVVVPARDEAETISASLTSLLMQDYAGRLRVVLVDDQSGDGTGDLARALPDPTQRLTVVSGGARPPGWSGKLWAVHQGVAAGSDLIAQDGYVLLSDADIVHDPAHVRALVARAESSGLVQVSEMVELNCESTAERLLVPAFVFFFAMLYPFAKVADPKSRVAAAAGGTILVRRDALEGIGGIASLRDALIDDCTLARRLKDAGGRLYLGHSRLAKSMRPYPGAVDVWRMIARTAYVQLRFSPVLLALTVVGMLLVWVAPLGLLLFAGGAARWIGGAAWVLSLASYVPTLRRFGMSPLWALALPGIAGFYLAATIGSAVDHIRGRGVRWKDRVYTEAGS